MGNYWKTIAARAAVEAAAVLKIDSLERVVIWLLGAVVIILGLLFVGTQGAAFDDLVGRLAIIAIIILTFPFIFLWKLLSVPAQVHGEQAKHLSVLRTELSKKLIGIAQTRILTVLWEQGADLMADRPNEGEYADWAARLDKWERLTLGYLATMYSHQDAVDFRVVETNAAQRVAHAINEHHAAKFRETSARTQRLKRIIDRNQTLWTPISRQDREQALAVLKEFEGKMLAAQKADDPQ